jgi:phosphoribosylformylglycinamidine cyclo-ligase
MVKKKKIITGDDISPGDALIGLPSSGIHSNGLSLARKIFEQRGIGYREKVKGLSRSVGLELLEPTTVYVRQVLKLVQKFNVRGMANITGGGLRNLIRLKKGVGFEIENPMKQNPIFNVMQELGNVTDEEMYQVFNMGMGYCLVAPQEEAAAVVRAAGKGAKVVGHAVRSDSITVPRLGLRYSKY